MPRRRRVGVEFVDGDVRDADDVMVGPVDAVTECSAEPSFLAGVEGGLDRSEWGLVVLRPAVIAFIGPPNRAIRICRGAATG